MIKTEIITLVEQLLELKKLKLIATNSRQEQLVNY